MMEIINKPKSPEEVLLHDIKVFVGSFIENGEISVMKVMGRLSKRQGELDDILKRLEKY
ncbi:MAG: hypothetical protein IKO89_06425 [Bacteroidales bacterium]|nr:hypothetical protein [Bacteroidales bacterium]MBR4488181.1 hypothetical protein [Bacteroidales bacterium]